jgi:epoxyqueuosine reductase
MNQTLSEQIKTRARSLGFQVVGLAKAEKTPKAQEDLTKWLSLGYHGTMAWMATRQRERGAIQKYFPSVKTVVSVGMNYFTGTQEKLPGPYKISNYAWGEDYHLILKNRLKGLLQWIQSQVPGTKGIICVDTSPVMDKVWAQKAGLGWQGKNTNLLTREYGSWLFLGELLLDIDLEMDIPFEHDLCGTCTACIEACPTGALKPYQIDARKCISYLTIEYREPFTQEEQRQLHGWNYGCDLCQEVCPWNQKFQQVTVEKAFQPREEILCWDRQKWDDLDEDGFRKLTHRSALKRVKFAGLKRNIKANQQMLNKDT